MKIIGICGHCGGDVVAPDVWYGTQRPRGRCDTCGATYREPLPILKMDPPPKRADTTFSAP